MSSSKTIAKNTLFLYFRMILVMGVSLFTSRIVLRELGVSDYGVYSLVGGIVAMFGFFNAAMSSATQRYLSFDIGKGDQKKLRKTFSATLSIHAGIALLVLILAETIGLWYVNYKMVFPPERNFAVNVVYQFSVFSFLLGIIQVPYNALIIARERMNVYAYVSILEVILKLIIVFMLVYFGSDKLITYAILTFVVSFIIRVIYQVYCRKHFKESKYKFEYDKEYYRELMSYSGWSLFGNIAAVARGQGINVVLNLFFGTVVNAAYGITLTVQGAVQSFVTNFQVAVNPQIIKNYAKGDLNAMQLLIFRSSKLSFFLFFILSFPIILNTEYILNLWLTVVPEHSVIFIQLAFIYLMIDSISYSLIIAVQATGKIKNYQIIIGTLIFLNLPICYLVLRMGGSPESVYFVLIAVTFLTLLFRMFFVKNLLGFKPIVFIKNVIFPIVLTALSAIVTQEILKNLFIKTQATNFVEFIAQSILYLLIAGMGILFIGIKPNERKALITFVKKR
ncbi:oligosaccharide flippase family protein [Moheibacter sp.]|uniref:oligosaccharide flippase family protein n=1 Tax=Moheibacter sp. TaxID=1965316 RepID=UPI003C77EA14